MGSLLLKIISLLLILPILLTGCGDSVDRQLAIADTLMEVAPDSAFAILKTIDTVSLKEKQSPYLWLLLAKVTAKQHHIIESDSLIHVASTFYEGKILWKFSRNCIMAWLYDNIDITKKPSLL